MVCTACGQETQESDLFCGKCGTSSPHALILCPGAVNTAEFTRLPHLYPIPWRELQKHDAELSRSAAASAGSPAEASDYLAPVEPELDVALPPAVEPIADTREDAPVCPDAAPRDADVKDQLLGKDTDVEAWLLEYIAELRHETPSDAQPSISPAHAAGTKTEAIEHIEDAIPMPAKDSPPPLSAGFSTTLTGVPELNSFDTDDGSSEHWRLWAAAVVLVLLGLLGLLHWRARTAPANGSRSVNPVSTAAMTPAPVASSPTAANSTDTPAVPPTTAETVAPASLQPAPAKSAPEVRTRQRHPTTSVSRERNTTVARLRKEIAAGDPDAPVNLANLYLTGKGVPRSCEQAMSLLKTAAERGNIRARNRIASMYEVGSCVERDRVEAYRWLNATLAVDATNEWALQNRNLTWQQMSADERRQAATNR